MPGKGEIDPDDGFMEHLARRGEPVQAVTATLAVAPPQRPRKAMASST
jgi:hypothetical protein